MPNRGGNGRSNGRSQANFRERQSDYIEVNERVIEFIEKNPEGSLQSEIERLDITGYTNDGLPIGLVVIKAYAYRTPDDPRPGVGWSSMVLPGKTPYTKGSEIENTETSAWGRAIVALGISAKRGIASAHEVRNAQEAQEAMSNGNGNGNGQRAAKPKAEDSEASNEEAEKRKELVKRVRERIEELDEMGTEVGNKHSVRAHVKKSEECGNFESMADLFSKGTQANLIATGTYVAGLIAEAKEGAKTA